MRNHRNRVIGWIFAAAFGILFYWLIYEIWA